MDHFPKSFYWGAATSAYQVEGDAVNADWWHWEQQGGGTESSGAACRHYEMFCADFDLAQELGHNAHRFSLEWSRIEPQEGVFSTPALEHYRQVVRALRERRLEPVVTLWHFTLPQWLAAQGGWFAPRARFYFLRFIENVLPVLGHQVRVWITINEPLVYAYFGYLKGTWPPQICSLPRAWALINQLARAHVSAYRLIHAWYRDQGLSSPRVSIAKNCQAFTACTGRWQDRLAVKLRNSLFNLYILNILVRKKSLDFIGVNYYTRQVAHVQKKNLMNLLLDSCEGAHDPREKNSIGWDVYPEGLGMLLQMLGRKYRLPLFITENGICTTDDGRRWRYIQTHIREVQKAREAGIEVIGYLYWSLLDNYEWEKGFAPRFGLVEVDYRTYERRVRESGRLFSQVCRSGICSVEG